MSLYDELFGEVNRNGPMLWHGLKQMCDRIEKLEEHTGGPLVVEKRAPGRPKKAAA